MANEMVKKEDDLFDFDIFDKILPALFIAIAVVAFLSVTPAFANTAASQQAYYQSQLYEGKSDPRTLKAQFTKQKLSLSPPWISAYFFNDGPNSVFIWINDTEQPTKIIRGESLTLDMSGAEKRIETIYYKCNATETASVRVVGKY